MNKSGFSEKEKRITHLNDLGNLSMSISKADNDNLKKRFNYFSPINSSSNIVRTKINILGRDINEENPPFGSYINRPIVNFIPRMELYELEPNNLINPSTLDYIVPISQPECHRRRYNSFGKNRFYQSNFNLDNYYNNNKYNNNTILNVERYLNNYFNNKNNNTADQYNDNNYNEHTTFNNGLARTLDFKQSNPILRNNNKIKKPKKDYDHESYMKEMRDIRFRNLLKANKLI